MPISRGEIKTRLSVKTLATVGALLTDVDLVALSEMSEIIGGGDKEALAKLGVAVDGVTDCTFCVLRPGVRVGNWRITNRGLDTLIVIGEPAPASTTTIHARVSASGSTLVFPDMRTSSIWLPDIFLRSPNQMFFWGAKASAVHAQIEIEGDGSAVLVGDDCMFSSGIWIRNYDMHPIFDVATGTIVNDKTATMLIEQHVWIGQGSLLLGSERIGYGSIIGANSLVNSSLQSEVLAVGSPARIIRTGISWSRSPNVVDAHTIERLKRLKAICAIEEKSPSLLPA